MNKTKYDLKDCPPPPSYSKNKLVRMNVISRSMLEMLIRDSWLFNTGFAPNGINKTYSKQAIWASLAKREESLNGENVSMGTKLKRIFRGAK